MNRKWLAAAAITAIGVVGIGVAENVVVVDPAIPSYKAVSGVSGSLSSIGSDTLNNLMTYWTEEFGRHYPGVAIQVEGKGSSTAPPALISGTSQLGPMSRAMKGSEIDQFEARHGYKPHCVRVAVDTLAVFVNKNNPVKSLSIPQIDAIFSKTQEHGLDEINTWGEAGVGGAWGETPISLYGRNSASGTYGFFKEFVKLVLSKEGQESVLKDGFYPLPAQVVQEELKALE